MGDDIKRFKLREEKHTVAEIELMAWSPTMDLLALANVNGEVSFIINLPACLYAHYIFLSFQFFFFNQVYKENAYIAYGSGHFLLSLMYAVMDNSDLYLVYNML